MIIRALKPSDLSSMLDWYNHYIGTTTVTFAEEPYTLPRFRALAEEVTRRYPWIVLETEGRPVGYAYLNEFNSRHAYRFTADVTIYLDPEECGKGYGTILLKALMEEAVRDGYHKLISLITSDNAASIHLHERCGFHPTARIEHTGYKFGRWISTVWQECDIAPFEHEPKEPQNLPVLEREI